MPVTISYDGKRRSVATEEELLAFVNKAREAGGANVLEALLPSKPEHSKKCLIARGLNFSCEVDKAISHPIDGQQRWGMFLPENMPFEQAKRIADALECKLVASHCDGDYDDKFVTEDPGTSWVLVILLPIPIGNAAEAFDARAAFQDYID